MKMMMKVFVVLVVLVVIGHISQHASSVSVSEGVESVLLPCQVPWFPHVTKVVWSRVGSNPSTVHQHQDGEEHYLQNQHYSRRASMSADALTTGDFSLTLREPNLSDSGLYICTVYRDNQRAGIAVPLDVKEPPIRLVVRLVVLLVVLLGVLLGVLLALCLYLWYKTITVSSVEVEDGALFVRLPFRTILLLPEDITVEWSRCAPEPMKVHEYRNGGNYLVRQDGFYCDRTMMQKEPLKTRDLSLTLRNPCFRDSGTFICTVHKDRDIWTQRVVRLRVRLKVFQEVVEFGEWATSVTLPFKTAAQLPRDATVEWTRSEPKPMMVHVYQNGQDQPDKQDKYYHGHTKMNNDPLQSKDLSLTIHLSGYSDRGTYICTVHRDGEILALKQVENRIKASFATVEVNKSARTVKLPWNITANLPQDATVEWCTFKIVHVYENGQDQPEKQDHFYRRRTKMVTNPLLTGDLSLTLTNLRDSDFGIYFCTVLGDGDVLWNRIVQLKVRERRWFDF